MKKFILETQQWLNHRLRQMIWKRWKKVGTRYRMLCKYGIDHENAIKLANSRKGYWRVSKSETIHRALSNKKLTEWGLKEMSALYELRY